jgi:hypothetical protein
MVFFDRLNLKKLVLNSISPTTLVGLIAFAFWILSNLNRPADFKREDHFLAPPKDLVHFTFGYNETMADTLWIRSIQDFDYCEQKINKTMCKGNSWLFRILDVVSDLSPHFRAVHSMGPIALSIIISDIEGASKIFDKATERFPNDWVILGRAAYHALYEENDKPKAARLLKQAAQNGGPYWYYSLAGRLYAEGGEMELGEALLKDLKESGQPDYLIERLTQRLEDFKKNQKIAK